MLLYWKQEGLGKHLLAYLSCCSATKAFYLGVPEQERAYGVRHLAWISCREAADLHRSGLLANSLSTYTHSWSTALGCALMHLFFYRV